jgi:hypothetical protein
MGGVFNTVNLHLYHYAGNNPVKYLYPDGKAVETFWDVTSLSIDIASLINNIAEGDGVSIAIDALGIVADVAAVALPVVPGGAGAAIKAVRGTEKVLGAVDDVATVIDGTAATVKSIQKGNAYR